MNDMPCGTELDLKIDWLNCWLWPGIDTAVIFLTSGGRVTLRSTSRHDNHVYHQLYLSAHPLDSASLQLWIQGSFP